MVNRMRRSLSGLVSALLAVALLVPMTAANAQEDGPRVLVFSATAGFRHASIPDGISAIQQLGVDHGFEVDATEDATEFTEENLDDYDAVVWLSTTGSVLDTDQQAAFEDYIQSGGGYVGIHAAADTHYDWEWYGGLVGAYFESHPHNQDAEILVTDRVHPSTRHLPARWERYDEWYNYQSNPRGDVHVLMSLDETSYDAGSGAMGHDHPIAWCHDYDGGRSWYTGGGHTSESFAEDAFVEHLAGGIQYAAGMVRGDCGGTVADNFDKILLTEDIGEPMQMVVAPDGRVVLTARSGELRIWDPATGRTLLAGTLPVFSGLEDGLIGVALDPDFANNDHVYLHYSHPSESRNQVSRFTLDGNTLDLDSEVVLLHWPTQRQTCCHSAGALDFDADGNLLIATGDNVSSQASDGHTPIDERPGRHAYDAQGTSGDTSDLRGKLLRITPLDADPGDEPGVGSTYDVPDDNLFTSGDYDHLFEDGEYDPELGAPEIYVMGLRNPFRVHADHETDTVVLGMVGNDAWNDSQYGPRAYDTLHRVEEAGNVGWPYCITPWLPFNDRDFATGQVGDPFDCDDLVNDSPNNNGLEHIPPVTQSPTVWYHRGFTPEFPEIDAADPLWVVGGPVYRHDDPSDPGALPAYFDGQWFWGEGGRNFTKTIHLDDDGEYLRLDPFEIPGTIWNTPHSYDVGPDGMLYVVEYGSGWFGPANDNGLYRIEYTGGPSPTPTASATPDAGADVPLEVQFSSQGSGGVAVAWDFGDGATSTERNPTHTYAAEGRYTATLTVTYADGEIVSTDIDVTVGTPPQIEIDAPTPGGMFDWGDEIGFATTVGGVEDVDCDAVELAVLAGTETLDDTTGCTGTIQTGEAGRDHPRASVHASYTVDTSGPGFASSDEVQIVSKHQRAADADGRFGIAVTPDAGAEGGTHVSSIDNGDWLRFDDVDLAGIETVLYRVASHDYGGVIELRSGDPEDGQLLSTAEIGITEEGTYGAASAEVEDPGGVDDLYVVFRAYENNPVGADLFALDTLTFYGDGIVADPEAGFETILGDTQASYEQWEHAGAGDWIFADGVVSSTGDDAGLGLLWYPHDTYEDFILRLEWRDDRTDDGFANSGVFVRFDVDGNPVGDSISQGHEIQIYDGPTGEPQKSGSLYGEAPLNLIQAQPIPRGEWNEYEIRVINQSYTVIRNGEVIQQHDNQNASKGASGHVGLQWHDPDSLISFRNVRVKEVWGPQGDILTTPPSPIPPPPPTEPHPDSIINTVGITTQANAANATIPFTASWPAQLLPDPYSVSVPPLFGADEPPILMPDTSGEYANLASAVGQTYTLPPIDLDAVDTLHLFGATTDGSQDGTFTLNYTDGTSEQVQRHFPDWVLGELVAPTRIAFEFSYRHRGDGEPGGNVQENLPLRIYHSPVPVDPERTLESITLPTAPSGNARIQIFGMTLELDGDYEPLDLYWIPGEGPGPTEPHPDSILDAVGITTQANAANATIPFTTSWPAELLPDRYSVSVPPLFDAGEPPILMPDTSGEYANVASAVGQTYTLPPVELDAIDTLHLFGATTDGSQDGTFTLNYTDGTSEQVERHFPDWVLGELVEPTRIAFEFSYRHRADGDPGDNVQENLPLRIYHSPVPVDPERTLESITLPDAPSGNARIRIIGMTVELDGDHEPLDLYFVPGDAPPEVSATLDPEQPDGEEGWYVSPVTVSLDAEPDGATPQWRFAGDEAWITWTEPVTIDEDGIHDLEYRATIGDDEPVPDPFEVQLVGLEFQPDDITVTQGQTIVYDQVSGPPHNVVTVDADGNEIDRNGAPSNWDTYEFVADEAGTFYVYCEPHADTGASNPANWTGMVASLQVDAPSGTGSVSSDIGELSFQIDQTPPETDASIDGELAGDAYIDEATLTLDAEDATSGVAETHWREVGEDHLAYDGSVTFDEPGQYAIEYRSVDVAGNVEDWQTVTFEIVEEVPPPIELELTLMASTRCVAGNVFVTVTARNDNGVAVHLELESEYGSRAFVGVVPDRFASHAFNTRSGGVDGGSVTVRANALVDGDEVSGEWTVDFDGLSC